MSDDELHAPVGPADATRPAAAEAVDNRVCKGALISTVTTPISLVSLYAEKRAGLGEDAEPMAEELAGGTGVVVGVFDGLGGSGATQIATVNGPRSSAYVASRLVRDISRAVIHEHFAAESRSRRKQAGADWGVLLRERLNQRLGTHLRAYQEEYGGTTSRLRSRLLRPLPTTLALAVVRPKTSAPFAIDVLWAGDSRVYLLSPEIGLQQLTVDDLKTGGDAMRNLSDESRMSNLVSADGRFHINLNQLALSGPAIVIAATDGCFGYVRTPAQFEGIILSCLRDTAAEGSWSAWQDALKREIVRVTGDDATLAMACVGWDSLSALAQSFAERGRIVGGMMLRLERAQSALAHARKTVETANRKLDDTAHALWAEYRDTYERLLPSPTPELYPEALEAAPVHEPLPVSTPAPPSDSAEPSADEARAPKGEA
ncbi:MAG TPA: hypothetical protein VFU65_11050 [Actinocrinis sp.]|nr:hypothetical protein [Actinocrinis sp.]